VSTVKNTRLDMVEKGSEAWLLITECKKRGLIA
jgi:hypothetical protein